MTKITKIAWHIPYNARHPWSQGHIPKKDDAPATHLQNPKTACFVTSLISMPRINYKLRAPKKICP
eukprot:1159065-Pelagomonas_calceolata.AAC.5